jgi:hypothetical protein
MVDSSIFDQIEQRAFDLRKNMGDVCAIARVAHSTWSRAKKRGFIRPRTLERIERALDFLDRQAAA